MIGNQIQKYRFWNKKSMEYCEDERCSFYQFSEDCSTE